jgi:5-methyltetrahydrofolate--homocysteine methyltransferase
MPRTLHVDRDQWYALLDREALLCRRWKLIEPGASQRARLEAELTLVRLWGETNIERLWRPKGIYAAFPARIREGALTTTPLDEAATTFALRFSAPFIEKLFRSHGAKVFVIGMQVVTVGPGVAERARKLGESGRVHDQFLLHGLAAELTEALAEYCQREVQQFVRWRACRRYSPGYPVWPELSEQKKVFQILGPEKIGVRLTESYQMIPEYSTSAVVIH